MTNEKEIIGRIIGISELNVKVLLFSDNVKINDILIYKDDEGIRKFEVVQIDNNIASTVPFERVIGLKKGGTVTLEEGGLKIEYSDAMLGKVFSPYGDVINHKELKSVRTRNVYDRKLSFLKLTSSSSSNFFKDSFVMVCLIIFSEAKLFSVAIFISKINIVLLYFLIYYLYLLLLQSLLSVAS